MSQELLYTSAPRGLKAGSRGFCTVLSTQGMPAPLATTLEGLSGYRQLYPPSDPKSSTNPVVFSHLKVQAVGRSIHLLSRIADYGLDYSQRANKLAHHVVLDQNELQSGGPAYLLATPGFMRDAWNGEPKVVIPKPVRPERTPPAGVCVAWKEMTGDAGWAGVVAEAFLADPDRILILLFAPGQDVLPLFVEAISLLPVEDRWNVTFSTYFTGLAQGAKCIWRGMVHDSKEAHESLRFVNALRIDLTARIRACAVGGQLVEAARTGIRPIPISKPFPSQSANVVGLPSAVTDVEFASADQEQEVVHVQAIPDLPIQLAATFGPPPIGGPPLPAPRKYVDANTEVKAKKPSTVWQRRVVATTVGLLLVTGLIGLAVIVPTFLHRQLKPHQQQSLNDDPANNQQTPSAIQDVNSNTSNTANRQIISPGEHTPPNTDSHGTAIPDDRKEGPQVADNKKIAAPLDDSSPGIEHPSTSASSNPTKNEGEQKVITVVPNEKLTTIGSEPTVIDLPSDGKPTKLFSFDLPLGQMPPKMHLLKPAWLPFFDDKPTTRQANDYQARWAVVENATGGDKPAIALFTLQTINATSHSYSLKSLKEDKIKWLAWYAVQLSDQVNPASQKLAVFAAFPLDSKKLNRGFNEGVSSWALPRAAVIDDKRMPQLHLDRFVLSIQEHAYPLVITDSEVTHEWRLALKDFEENIFRSLELKPSSNPTLKIGIKVGNKNDEPCIQISMIGVAPFQELVVDMLTRDFSKAKKSFFSLATDDAQLNDLANKNINEIRVKSELVSEQAEKLMQPIHARLNTLRAETEKSKNAAFITKITSLQKELDQLVTSVTRIVRYHEMINGLKKTVIKSARIYYHVASKDKSIMIPIDIVNFDFDDNEKAGSTKESK